MRLKKIMAGLLVSGFLMQSVAVPAFADETETEWKAWEAGQEDEDSWSVYTTSTWDAEAAADAERKAEEADRKCPILDIAAEQVGYSAGYYKDTKFGAWYGANHNDWCAMFVAWCANQLGYIDEGILPRLASCTALKSWFQSKGEWHSRSSGYIPEPGDPILFCWDGCGGADHVGFVEYVEDGYVHTIEGNTNTWQNSNGMCIRKSYRLGYYGIAGYGHPDYPVEEKTYDMDTEEGRAGYIYKELISNGFSPEAACGVIANMDIDSGLDPESEHGNDGAYGLLGWLGDKKSELKERKDSGDIDVQLNYFLSTSLKTKEEDFKTYLNGYVTPAEGSYIEGYKQLTCSTSTCAKYFCWAYEKPSRTMSKVYATNTSAVQEAADKWYDILTEE